MANIRHATQRDVVEMAHVLVETWREVYRGLVPASFLDAMNEQSQRNRYSRYLKAEGVIAGVACGLQDEVTGFVVGGPERSGESAFTAELYAIYVLPAHSSRGTGTKLTSWLANDLVNRGHTSMLVWVFRDNPYRKFYERLGGVPVGSDLVELDGSLLPLTAYGWTDLRQLVAK